MDRAFTFFMMLRSTAAWRALDADAHEAVFDGLLSFVFNGYPDLRMTHYAAGAADERCSDVIVWETTDAAQYHEAVDALGDTAFFGTPLFDIVEVIAAAPGDARPVENLTLPLQHVVFEEA